MSTEKQVEGFFLPSKQEYEEEQQSDVSLVADDYIVKVAKIDLRKAPTFEGGRPNWSNLTLVYKTICLPVALKGGGIMRDVNGQEVKPLTKWIFRDINPYATGFQPDKVTPSMLRGFITHLEGIPVQNRIKAPGFILVDKDKEVVLDEGKRQQFLSELQNPDATKTLMNAGYQALPDIRPYAGKYISCAVEIDSKGRSKITRFSKMPDSFVEPTAESEAEALGKFEESYQKMIEKQNERDKQKTGGDKVSSLDSPVDSAVVTSEVVSEEIPF